MGKRIGVLEVLLENTVDYDIVEQLLIKMSGYYDIYDLEHGTNHCGVFHELYFDRMRYARIFRNNYISEPTLSRYIKKYNGLAKKMIERDFKGLEIALK